MKNVGRTQSIIYVGDDDAPVLKFGSLERGGIDDDDEIYHKNSNLFVYNGEEDVYRVNSQKKSRLLSNTNLDIIPDEELKINEYNQTSKEDDENISGGNNIIFAKLSNLILKEKKLTPLYIIMLSYLSFCLLELLCEYYSNSKTIMADAAHYFSESSCFGIYIITIYASKIKASNDMSFGFHRGEIIGILVRASFLLGFSFWLIYYIFQSFIYIEKVNGIIVIIIGVISTFFNLIMGLVLILLGLNNDISFSEKQNGCQHHHLEDELNCKKIRISFTNIIFNSLQSCIIILAYRLLIYFFVW